MVEFAREVANHLPLAEAALNLFSWICQDDFLDEVFQKHRGRSYEREITFLQMVRLVSDALMQHHGSGHQSFQRAKEEGELETDVRSVYRKLSYLPISLSMGFFQEATKRLQEIYPESADANFVPKSLRQFAVCVHDGKTIKHLQKRMKVLRSIDGSILGGRMVISLDLQTKLATGFSASEDGESGETPLLPEAMEQTRGVVSGPKLHVGDRAYFGFPQMEEFTQHGDHFVLRFHKKRMAFHPDPEQDARTGTDRYGRSYTEDWGWLGGPKDPRRRYVRRIQLHRPEIKDELILITDLTNARRYPADDILEVYLQRWTIEDVFQQVTEVFHLDTLIGSAPKATVFQAAFCFLLYNMIQVIRAYIAEGQDEVSVEEISSENVFIDVERQLIAWTELLSVIQTVQLLAGRSTATQVRRRLKQLLRDQWSDRWLKAPSNTHRKPQKKKSRSTSHNSAFRILQAHKLKTKT
jgi:hypothetical protein